MPICWSPLVKLCATVNNNMWSFSFWKDTIMDDSTEVPYIAQKEVYSHTILTKQVWVEVNKGAVINFVRSPYFIDFSSHWAQQVNDCSFSLWKDLECAGPLIRIILPTNQNWLVFPVDSFRGILALRLLVILLGRDMLCFYFVLPFAAAIDMCK